VTEIASFRLLGLRIGRVQTFGPAGQMSGIAKTLVSGPIELGKQGLVGDEQADKLHHGGIDKALHHYPFEHYAAWAAALPEQAHLFHAGGFGENLSTQGLHEDNVCLGDIFLLGSALIQVSQGRTPCWKLNHRFGRSDMVHRVQISLRTGWYYRVLTAGSVMPDDPLTLMQRPYPDWPLTRLFRQLHHANPVPAALAEIAGLEVLSPSWREKALNRLDTVPKPQS
jgi:MOSC domain-containing protein YiiM